VRHKSNQTIKPLTASTILFALPFQKISNYPQEFLRCVERAEVKGSIFNLQFLIQIQKSRFWSLYTRTASESVLISAKLNHYTDGMDVYTFRSVIFYSFLHSVTTITFDCRAKQAYGSCLRKRGYGHEELTLRIACGTQEWRNFERTSSQLRQFHEHHIEGSISNKSGRRSILEVEGVLHSREHSTFLYYFAWLFLQSRIPDVAFALSMLPNWFERFNSVWISHWLCYFHRSSTYECQIHY
jgi:hypothetical protein